jgi:hypothetical protein
MEWRAASACCYSTVCSLSVAGVPGKIAAVCCSSDGSSPLGVFYCFLFFSHVGVWLHGRLLVPRVLLSAEINVGSVCALHHM